MSVIPLFQREYSGTWWSIKHQKVFSVKWLWVDSDEWPRETVYWQQTLGMDGVE